MKIFAVSIALAASALCAEMQPGKVYSQAGTSVMIKHACSAPVSGFVCVQVEFSDAFDKSPFALVTANPSGPGIRHTIVAIVHHPETGKALPAEAYIPATSIAVSAIWVWPLASPAAFLRQ